MIKFFAHTRLPDWRSRLSDYVHDKRNVPFSYEEDNDCVKWTAGAVEAMTGENPLKGLPEWHSRAEAKAVLKQLRVRSHVSIIKQMFLEIPPREAIPGDIVVMEKHSLGIMQGQYVYRPSGGLSLADDITRAFRVEE